MEKFDLTIQPSTGFTSGIKELWQYRELFYFFTWRDIKVKYKQTYLGLAWALLQPLGMMLIFTLIFSKTLKIDTGPTPYPVFVLSGLICWGLFSTSVANASESMIQHANIIKKIYFPRLIIPCSAILVALFDFVISLIILIILCIWYKQPVSMNAIIYFPAGILIMLLAAFGAGTILAALNIKYRDFRYVVPFLLQVLFFSSQVIYPIQLIPTKWIRDVLSLNPLNSAIELFRSPITGAAIDQRMILIGLTVSLLVSVAGLFYFRKTEQYFADLA